ncbi:uncharacterized protein BDZ99DRAFT_500158 [Mytilinidion resinicola]|uniref:Uncharacterized protein n=1 Tax=Mytilinidion resinicola TaxID=574789 RepID=A0A6A6YGD1_9PEZI|nr:uncharacterized protein BDZ99DRAFT_500158 [Mytilinidion resinicola]KAF2807861.1 hypothetical protein BDZ99DRAFT_500158 [Mytilinidion resinicola]
MSTDSSWTWSVPYQQYYRYDEQRVLVWYRAIADETARAQQPRSLPQTEETVASGLQEGRLRPQNLSNSTSGRTYPHRTQLSNTSQATQSSPSPQYYPASLAQRHYTHPRNTPSYNSSNIRQGLRPSSNAGDDEEEEIDGQDNQISEEEDELGKRQGRRKQRKRRKLREEDETEYCNGMALHSHPNRSHPQLPWLCRTLSADNNFKGTGACPNVRILITLTLGVTSTQGLSRKSSPRSKVNTPCVMILAGRLSRDRNGIS